MTSYQVPQITAHELDYMRDKTFVWQIDAPPEQLSDEDMQVLSVDGTLTLKRDVNIIRCIADLKAKVRLTSDRTLETYDADLDLQFEEGLEVVKHHNVLDDAEYASDDVMERVGPEETIDLLELLRQYLILSLPMQKLESENCYNEELSQYAQDPSALETETETEMDPAWQAIRETVKSWEQPSEN